MNLLPSLAALFAVALGYGALVPLAPLLAQTTMSGMSPSAIAFHTGALTSSYLVALAVFAPLWGRQVDRSSRMRIAITGLTGFTVSFAILSLATGVTSLYAGAVLAGSFAGAIGPSIQAQLGEVEGEERKARGLARFGAASFAGWFLGPSLATWAARQAEGLGWPPGRLALGAVAASGMLAAILMLRLADKSPLAASAAPKTAPPPTAGPRLFLALGMAITFAVGAFEVSLMLWSVQVLRLDQGMVSRMLVECTLVMMAAQVIITIVPAARPRWHARLAGSAFLIAAVAMAATPWARSSAWLFVSVAVIAIAATVLQAMLALGTLKTAGQALGAFLGLQLSLSSIAQAAGSFSAGALFSAMGTGFLMPAAVLAVAAGVALRRRDG